MCDDATNQGEALHKALVSWPQSPQRFGINLWLDGWAEDANPQVSWSEGLEWTNATWCKREWKQQAVCSFGISCNCQSKHHVTPLIVTCLQKWSTVDPWSLLEIVEQLAMMYVYTCTHFFCPGQETYQVPDQPVVQKHQAWSLWSGSSLRAALHPIGASCRRLTCGEPWDEGIVWLAYCEWPMINDSLC